jgi:hypothetical protein
VVRPAEAEAERVRILALADAEKMRIQATAASNDRVALDQMSSTSYSRSSGKRRWGSAAPTSTSSTERTASARSRPGWSARD